MAHRGKGKLPPESVLTPLKKLGSAARNAPRPSIDNELPIERAAKFELVINLNAAKGISLHVPESLLLRADEVIE